MSSNVAIKSVYLPAGDVITTMTVRMVPTKSIVPNIIANLISSSVKVATVFQASLFVMATKTVKMCPMN